MTFSSYPTTSACFFASPAELAAADFPATDPEILKYRILYMGSPDFALPPLAALLQAGYNIVAVASQPDRKVGRKQKLQATVVKEAATNYGLPTYTWTHLRTPQAMEDLAVIQPDLIISSAYGNILPESFLAYPRFSCLNIHPSMLPRWRGASPIASAIMAGDEETAVCIMQTSKGLDDGDLLAACCYPISIDCTTPELSAELAQLSSDLLLKILPLWFRGELPTYSQANEGISYAAKLERADGLLDFRQTARYNHDKIRALQPWPGAYSFYQGQRYKFLKSHIIREKTKQQPGEILRRGKELIVACQDYYLSLERIQSPHGKILQAHDCYHNFAEGSTFTLSAE